MSQPTTEPTGAGRTKRDIIVKELRRMIASGQVPRGSRMRQDALAERFQTSITPVREALRVLEAEGVLVGEPRRGVRVADVDMSQVKLTYIMRQLAETYAMQRAARRVSALDLERAGKLLAAMREAHERGDDDSVRENNRAFHFLLIGRCGIPELVAELESLWLSVPWDILQVVETRTPHSLDEHEAILAAMGREDVDAVAAETKRHLRESYLELVEHLTGARPPDPFDVDND